MWGWRGGGKQVGLNGVRLEWASFEPVGPIIQQLLWDPQQPSHNMAVPSQTDRKTDILMVTGTCWQQGRHTALLFYIFILRFTFSTLKYLNFSLIILKLKASFEFSKHVFSHKNIFMWYGFSTKSATLSLPNCYTPCVKDSSPLCGLISLFISQARDRHAMELLVDGWMPCKTDSHSPALYKDLLLGTLFVSPLTSCICHFTPGERVGSSWKIHMRRERERSKRLV